MEMLVKNRHLENIAIFVTKIVIKMSIFYQHWDFNKISIFKHVWQTFLFKKKLDFDQNFDF